MKTPFKFEIVGRIGQGPLFGVGEIYDFAIDAQRAARLLAAQFPAAVLRVRPLTSIFA